MHRKLRLARAAPCPASALRNAANDSAAEAQMAKTKKTKTLWTVSDGRFVGFTSALRVITAGSGSHFGLERET